MITLCQKRHGVELLNESPFKGWNLIGIKVKNLYQNAYLISK